MVTVCLLLARLQTTRGVHLGTVQEKPVESNNKITKERGKKQRQRRSKNGQQKKIFKKRGRKKTTMGLLT